MGGLWNFSVPVFSFIAYPLLNLVFSSSHSEANITTQNSSSHAFRYVALAYVPVIIAVNIWAVYVLSTAPFSLVAFTGLSSSVGIINGVLGFTLAHEFIHRHSLIEQVAGHVLLLLNNYMHYASEHVWGHHVYACTPIDPHTARLNESLYKYLPRSIKYTFCNAMEIERKRLHRKKRTFFNFSNRLLLFGVLQLLLVSLLATLSWTVLIFYLFQNMVSILLLHTVDYLQHYGLMRKQTASGRYEKLTEKNAWNTALKNKINLFQLENHADHHMHPNRQYHQLAHKNDAPEHPAGYSFMLLLTLVPPLWFRVMNKRIPEM